MLLFLQDRVCSSKCSRPGCRSMDVPKKMQQFDSFYKKDYNEQTAFLSDHISIGEPRRRRSGKTDATSSRTSSFSYYVKVNGELMQVCQKTFCDTFQISFRRVQILQAKLKNGDSILEDNRGRHHNRPHATSNSAKDKIREYIKSIPRQPSHYSRKKSNTEYLDPKLNVSKLAEMFKEKYPDVVVGKHTFKDIFRSEFNLQFGLPRSDTCRICDELFVKLQTAETEQSRKQIQVESHIHHAKADSAYTSLKSDIKKAKDNPSYVVLCKDMQQVLFCPDLRHSSVFYQRQLSCYNLAIHDMGENIATMHLWHECIAKRGSVEVASCMFHYVTNKFKKLAPSEERSLIVWSDRCVGQNNNWKLIGLYQYFVRSGYFSKVEQKFLCSGHSFLPCDRDFALIERAKKAFSVMVPEEWKYVVADACATRPFEVIEMEQKDFKDLNNIDKFIKRDPNLKITQNMWLQISSDDPHTIRVRKSHNVLQPWSQYGITKFGKGKRAPPLTEDFPPIYEDPLPITSEKKSDLLNMCPLMELKYREFYYCLPAKDTVNHDEIPVSAEC